MVTRGNYSKTIAKYVKSGASHKLRYHSGIRVTENGSESSTEFSGRRSKVPGNYYLMTIEGDELVGLGFVVVSSI